MPIQGEFDLLVFLLVLVFWMFFGLVWEYVRLFRVWGKSKLKQLRPSSFGNACLVGMPRTGGMWIGLVFAQYYGVVFLLVVAFFSFVWPRLVRGNPTTASLEESSGETRDIQPAEAPGVNGGRTPKGRTELVCEYLRGRLDVRAGEEGLSFRSDLGMQKGSLFILLDELGEDLEIDIGADDAESVDSIDDVLGLISRL